MAFDIVVEDGDGGGGEIDDSVTFDCTEIIVTNHLHLIHYSSLY